MIGARGRLAAFGLVCVGTLAACGGAERSGVNEDSSAAEGPPAAPQPGLLPAGFTAFPSAGVPNTWPERERGLGVVYLDPEVAVGGAIEDTLVARERPDSTAPVLARLVLDTVHVYRFEARDGLLETPGALEYGYEDVGFPILERGVDGWERVYLGIDDAGAVVAGWVRTRPGSSTVTLWEELLPETPLFFVPQDSTRFHAAPDGPEESFPVEGDDYILWPLERRGDWLRVRAAAPSDYCAPLDAPAPRQDTFWIRWRTETGRPRVWFFTRGC